MTKHNFFLLCVAGGISLAGISSCKKQNTAGPAITGVRAGNAEPNDSALSYVNPGQYVILDGINLATTQQVLFDGVSSGFNTALAAENTLVVEVPSIPFTSLDTTKKDQIEVITTTGHVIYHFPVVPPPPAVAAISNEFAHPGDVITLTGQYMYLIQSITFPGGVACTQFTSTPDGTTLTLTVPPGATTGGGIVISTQGGTSSSEPAAGFNDKTGMLCNFDDFNQYSWGATGVVNDDAFTGHDGYFAEMTVNNIPAGDQGWYNGNRAVATNNVQWIPTANMSDPISSYAMKFEIYAKVPYVAGDINVVPNYNFTYLATTAIWKTQPGSAFISTTQWTTVVIPLTAFQTNNGAGSQASSLSTLLGNGNASIQIMLYAEAGIPIGNFDMGVDNIRVVKIK